MFFTVEGLLSEGDCHMAESLIGRSRFVDGAITAEAEASSGNKKNQEMEASENYVTLTELLNEAIDSSEKIDKRIYPRYRTNPIINRYESGMFYGEHIDNPIQGGITQFGRSAGRFGQNFLRTDYSMTLFLSEPESYDGGELQLRLLGESRLVKLRAGSAVCYATGVPHSVRPVTRGYRIAAIYWFQSFIRVPQIRSELWDQYCLESELTRAGQPQLAKRAATVHANLVRYLAEI